VERKRLAPCLSRLLRDWRRRRRSSQRVLADFAGAPQSVVASAERGLDARVSTWERLFEALGCRLVVTIPAP